MHLKYGLTAGLLMKSVDILGDYGFKLSFFLKLRKLIMCDIRLYTVKQYFLPVKSPS